MSCLNCKHSVPHPAEGWVGCLSWSNFRHFNKYPDIMVDAADGEYYNAVRLYKQWIQNEDKDLKVVIETEDYDTEMDTFIQCLDKLGPDGYREGWLTQGDISTNYCIIVNENNDCPAYRDKDSSSYDQYYYYLPEELGF